jgi:hypothetical protein
MICPRIYRPKLYLPGLYILIFCTSVQCEVIYLDDLHTPVFSCPGDTLRRLFLIYPRIIGDADQLGHILGGSTHSHCVPEDVTAPRTQ